MAREFAVSARVTLLARVEQYLTERRRVGFELKSMEPRLKRFAEHVFAINHQGALTVELMTAWARLSTNGHGNSATWARRLASLRPFTAWLRQFDPATEIPDEAVFGRLPGRMAPHIYREQEIVDLLAAAGKLGPPGGLRPATMQTLFGLLACTGLRISEALALTDADVDLKAEVLTIRQSKFGKSRLVPLHPTAAQALALYRMRRCLHAPITPQAPFFIGSRCRQLGNEFSDREIHRIFAQLREQLGWVDRGSHGSPRIHDLRHSFAVRRLMLWHKQEEDVSQRMLALSTYLGHAKVSCTYWYLTGVPELMGVVGRRFERFADPTGHGDE
jgi:integrase